jgi:hypothetical protein
MILFNKKAKNKRFINKMYINANKINEIRFFEKGLFYTNFIIRNILFSLDNGYRFEMFPVEIDILRRLNLEKYEDYLSIYSPVDRKIDEFEELIKQHRSEFLNIIDEIESEVDFVFNKMANGGENTVIKLDYLRFKRCL